MFLYKYTDKLINQTHFRVQRLALQRGVLCLLPLLSQSRAPLDFLGYSLLTFSIVAHLLGFVKRFSRKNSRIFSFIPCVPLRRGLNVIGERSIATSNRSPTPTCGSGVPLLTLFIVAHFALLVKGKFQISLKFFRLNPDGSDPSLSRFPLDIIYYNRLTADYN